MLSNWFKLKNIQYFLIVNLLFSYYPDNTDFNFSNLVLKKDLEDNLAGNSISDFKVGDNLSVFVATSDGLSFIMLGSYYQGDDNYLNYYVLYNIIIPLII